MCKAIGEMLEANSTLKVLRIPSNYISSEGCKLIAQGLAKNTGLVQFSIAGINKWIILVY